MFCMKDLIVVSDFDGTITLKDGLYTFIQEYAKGDWEKIERDWAEGRISSKECLTEEFKLVPDLSEELISSFVRTINIDEHFKTFCDKLTESNIDFCVVSDGIDYFINRILKHHGIYDIKIISNHGEFRGEFFEIKYPNDSEKCTNNAGTCKCKVLSDFKQEYKKVIYIGDGVSDYCVADKADVLYAKSRLLDYCKNKDIKCIPFDSFADIDICKDYLSVN